MSDEFPPPSGSEETPQAQPSEKPQDELGDLRASMAEEEEARRKAKKSGLLKKMTGLLRRQTNELPAEPGHPQAQADESGAAGPFTAAAPEDEMSEDAFADKVGEGFSGWPEPVAPDPLETRPLIWDEGEEAAGEVPSGTGAEAAPAEPAAAQPAFTVEDLEPTPAFSDDIDEGEAPLTPPASTAFEMPPAGGAFKDGDWAGEVADEPAAEAAIPPQPGASTWRIDEIEAPENAETESLRAELMPEASPEPVQPAQPPRKRSLRPRSWRKAFTDWLNPDEVREEVPQDVADELLEDRLQRVHSGEYPAEIPGTHKASGAFDEPLEGAAQADEGDSGEVSLWKPRVERDGARPAETGERSSGIQFESPSGWGQESRLPRNWVDGHAGYLTEEPLAEDLIDKPEAGDQPLPKAPSLLAEAAAQAGEGEGAAPGIEAVRSQALEDYVEPEYVPVVVREPFRQRARAWTRRNLPVLIGLAVVLVVAGALALTRPWTRSPIAQPNTPVPSEQPYPVGLELTGGWFFDVNRSTIVGGVWQPQGAEWLDNSQVRRVVALPWNDQSQAVVQTLKRGDQINLVFNNNDLMPFLVRSVERLEKGDTGLFSENSPGLVIFLYGEESEQRWVVLALPK